MRAFVARHRSLAVTTLSGIVVAALVTTAALVSGGYAAQADGPRRRRRLGLERHPAAARAGQHADLAAQLGRGGVEPHARRGAVGQTVLLVDQGSNAVGIVDPATAELGKTTPLPSRSPTIALAGDRAVVGSEATGQFWMMAVDQLPLFSAQVAPTVDLGSRVVSSVEPDGTMFAFSADASSVYRIDARRTTPSMRPRRSRPARAGRPRSRASGGRWAVLNASARTLSVAERTVPLPDWLGTDAVLQQPADSGSRFYVASRTGLVAVGPTGTVTTILRASLGAPAAPCSGGTAPTRPGPAAPPGRTATARAPAARSPGCRRGHPSSSGPTATTCS